MYARCAACLLVLLTATRAGAETPPTAIFIMRADGSDVRKIAQVEGYEDHEAPRWSHDGARLVFDARHAGTKQRSCFVVNTDGTGLLEVAQGKFADWSPDDRQIAFEGQGNSSGIYVQNLDGQGLTRIRQGGSPRWSIDGSLLVYSDRTMLRSVDLLSDDETALLPEPVASVFNGLAFSPDGQQMAVVVRPREGARRQLLFVKLSGDNRALKPRLQNEMGGFISFSPDGKQLVFSDAMQIRIVDVAGNAPPRKLPNQIGPSKHPSFSPDGQWIAFAGARAMPLPAPQKAAGDDRAAKEAASH